ncbi:hypothetical protein B566_EDAN012031 [Ephemera danica]|nr:hypothetical protein B566_EDAN012031 [Ephemera danica]
MFVEDLKTGFYDLLIGKRVVIFVNYDIDAICSYKILQHLFKYDEILFTMVPVQGIQDLRRAFEETPNENVVVLINCGGTLDIVERLEPDPDVVFFIVDSHRPTDVCNIYSQSQIRLLRRVDEDENIPEFGEIFRDDEVRVQTCWLKNVGSDVLIGVQDESEPEDSEDEEGRRDLEATLMKRRERREWESRRDKAMFEYCSFSYYGRAPLYLMHQALSFSAAVLFELAWKLSKDNLELLWWGVVGLTEQHLLGKVEPHRFLLDAGTLQSHMLRLSHKQDTSDQGSTLKVSFDKEYPFLFSFNAKPSSSPSYVRPTTRTVPALDGGVVNKVHKTHGVQTAHLEFERRTSATPAARRHGVSYFLI